MAYMLTAGDTGYKLSADVWEGIIDLTVEAGYSVVQLRGLPRHHTEVDLPDGVVIDLDEALRQALEAGKPFPPGGDPKGADPQVVLTRDTIHHVRDVLRSGKVRLARIPSWHIGEDAPDVTPSG
jgi:hypothetical protein